MNDNAQIMTQENKLNLYMLTTKDYDYVMFVFAHTANRAKKIASIEFDEEYINMRVKTVVKNTDILEEAAVVCEGDNLYDKVKEYGCYFTDEDGDEL